MSLDNRFEGVWWSPWQVEAWIKQHAPHEPAKGALLSAMTKGTLTAWGQPPGRDRGGSPATEGAAAHVPVPVEVFANPVLTLQAAHIGPALGSPAWYADLNRRNAAFYALAGAPPAPALFSLYVGVVFKAADVRRRWPATSREPRPNACKAIAPASLDAALRTYCNTLSGGRVKQGDAENHLRVGTRCSRNAARAAYNRLSLDMKMKPGKPAASNPATVMPGGNMQG